MRHTQQCQLCRTLEAHLARQPLSSKPAGGGSAVMDLAADPLCVCCGIRSRCTGTTTQRSPTSMSMEPSWSTLPTSCATAQHSRYNRSQSNVSCRLCTARQLRGRACPLCCVALTAVQHRQTAERHPGIIRQSTSAGTEPRSRLALLLYPCCRSCGAVPVLQGPAVDPPACSPGHPAAAGGPAAPVTWQDPPHAAARRHPAAVSVPAVRMVQAALNELRLHWAAACGRSTRC